MDSSVYKFNLLIMLTERLTTDLNINNNFQFITKELLNDNYIKINHKFNCNKFDKVQLSYLASVIEIYDVLININHKVYIDNIIISITDTNIEYDIDFLIGE